MFLVFSTITVCPSFKVGYIDFPCTWYKIGILFSPNGESTLTLTLSKPCERQILRIPCFKLLASPVVLFILSNVYVQISLFNSSELTPANGDIVACEVTFSPSI